MYNKCCVVNCKSRRKDINFFRFPKTEIGLIKWLESINDESLRSSDPKKHFVCKKHFEKRFLASANLRCRLRSSAYPTLFTPEEILCGYQRTTNTVKINQINQLEHNIRNNNRNRKHEDHTYYKFQCSEKKPWTENDPTDRKERTAELPLSETNFDQEHITDSESLPDVVKPVCQICLSTDFESIDTDSALVDFYDELVYYEASVSEPQFCPLCQHFLKKSYNFRQKCRRGHILLHKWLKSGAKDRRSLESLQNDLPTSAALGMCTTEAKFIIYDCESDSLEAETETINESIDSKQQLYLGQVENDENGREDTEEVESDVRTYFEGFLDTNVDFTDIENEEGNSIEERIAPNIAEATELIKHEQQSQRKENYAQRQVNRIKSNFKECVSLLMDKGKLNDIEDQGTVLTKIITRGAQTL